MIALRSTAGYTLGELMTVIALSAVVAATAVPTASTILKHQLLTTTTRRLAFEISRARMEAVGQNAFVRITLVGTDHYIRERSTDGLTYAPIDSPISLPSGFTVLATDGATPRFDRQGLAPASTRLTVRGPYGERTVYINVLGRVTTS